MNKKMIFLISIEIFGLIFCLGSFVGAGDLNPSAPPGSTMKTLDEVEPRIPIHQSDIPLSITASGSYYLAEEVRGIVGPLSCITVNADDVTIDLGGFVMSGWDSVSSYGVFINGRSNVEIRNGTLRDFDTGIIDSDGKNHRVLGVRVLSCVCHGVYFKNCECCRIADCTIVEGGTVTGSAGTVYAICVGSGGIVTGNSVYHCGIATSCRVYGIEAGSGSTVTGNTVYGNGTASTNDTVTGIWAGSSSTVAGNSVYDNGDSAFGAMVYGIAANYACIVTGNSVYSNGTGGYTVRGLSISSGSTVAKNTAYDNGDNASGMVYGIFSSSGNTVTDNTVYSNGTSATGSGVYGFYINTGCTVTGNNAYGNGNSASGTVYGIYLAGYDLVNNNAAYNNAGTGGGANMNASASSVYGTNLAP